MFQQTMQENQRLNFAFMNHLLAEMEFISGVPVRGPRIQIPLPTYVKSAPITMNTTNNIRVEAGSQVGQINSGAINYLDHAVNIFNNAGASQFASALQSFTQQVVDSQEITAQSQREVLDLLREVVEQARKPQKERNLSVFKLALQTIGTLTSAAKAIEPHWEALKKFFEHITR